MSTSITSLFSVAILITTAPCASARRVVAQVVSWWRERAGYVCNWFTQDLISQPAAVPRPGFHTPNASARASSKMSFISSSMIKVSENIRRSSAHAVGRSFLLVSSRPPVGILPSVVQRDHSQVVQSLMEPSHNDPLNHMPAPLSCNFGAPQPRQQRWSSFGTRGNFARNNLARGNFASNFGAPCNLRATWVLPVNLASNCRCSWSTSPATFGAPGQLATSPATSVLPATRLQRSQATSPATCALLINLASDFGTPWPLSFCEPLNCFLVHNL